MTTNQFEMSETKTEIRNAVALEGFYKAVSLKKPGETFTAILLPGKNGFMEKKIADDFRAGKFNGVKIVLYCFEKDTSIYSPYPNSYNSGPRNAYYFLQRWSGINTLHDVCEKRGETLIYHASNEEIPEYYRSHEIFNFFGNHTPSLISSHWYKGESDFTLHYLNLDVKVMSHVASNPNINFPEIDFAWIDLCGVPSSENIKIVEGFSKRTKNLFATFCKNLRRGTRHPDLKDTTKESIVFYFEKFTGKKWEHQWDYLNGGVKKNVPMLTIGYTQQTTQTTNNMSKNTKTTTLQNEIKSFAVKLMSKGYPSKEVAAAL